MMTSRRKDSSSTFAMWKKIWSSLRFKLSALIMLAKVTQEGEASSCEQIGQLRLRAKSSLMADDVHPHCNP